MADFPKSAKVVIIGGGAVGASALYHLALRGETDVVLLEKNELTSGSTWHAAGNCPVFSGSWAMLQLQKYSTDLFDVLAEKVDYPMNYHRTGSIRLAQNTPRMEEFRHVTDMANYLGIKFEMQTADELKERCPQLETHNLEGGLYDANDGDIDPAQLTQAYAKGARDLGATVIRFSPVMDLKQREDDRWEVVCEKGIIVADKVINASGYYAPQIGEMVGRKIPSVSMQHQYLVTEAIPELAALDKKIPLIRDPDDSYYLRQEGDGLILGPYEWKATPHWEDGKLPDDFSFQLYPDDLERLEWYIEQACERFPLLGTVGVKNVINGPIPYTPDGNPLIGPAPGLKNFFEACVFSFGIVQSGGAGKLMADWILDGNAGWDSWAFDPRRYTGHVNLKYTTLKAIELYQQEYAIGYPNEHRPAGRTAKTSPLYAHLKAKGAEFGAFAGWERATWFPRPQDEAGEKLSYHRTNWFESVGEEVKAISEGVGILDLPGFSKFEVKGEGAADWLDSVVASRLPSVGRVSLAYVCNERGGIVSEFTISRLAQDSFILISAASSEYHDEDILNQYLPNDGSITINNVSGKYTTLVVAGPKARDVIQKITHSDMSNDALKWLAFKSIEIGSAPIMCARVGYVGELSYELHMQTEYAMGVYEYLWEAGEEFDVRDFGMFAMDSMRLEKCYRAWKHDLVEDYSPLMGSLDRFVKLDKESFPGKAALLKEKQEGSSDKFVPLIVEATTADAPFCSIVYHGDEPVGLVTGGGYGHRIGKSIALSYVRSDLAVEGQELEVAIVGERCKAVVSSEPLFDPENERLRA